MIVQWQFIYIHTQYFVNMLFITMYGCDEIIKINTMKNYQFLRYYQCDSFKTKSENYNKLKYIIRLQLSKGFSCVQLPRFHAASFEIPQTF